MAAQTTKAITYNADVRGIVRRINRFIQEIFLSQSSGVSKTSTFDVARAKSYINAIRSYVAWVVNQPELDLPETGPQAVDLPPNPVVPDMENESLFDLATLFETARNELANSQSSRLSSNLIPFDAARLGAIFDKADIFISSYIEVVDPLDLPESSPQALVTGPGKTGV